MYPKFMASYQSTVHRELTRYLWERTSAVEYELFAPALFPSRHTRGILLLSLSNYQPQTPLPENIVAQLAAIELIHRASIIVDDLVDGDEIRRGKLAFHKEYGTETTVILAHHMVGLAFRLLACSAPSAVTAFTIAYHEMALGELYDIGALGNSDQPVTNYENYALKKTVALFELLFQLAAANRLDCSNRKFSNLAKPIGTFYQITNDYFDFFEQPSERGRNDVHRLYFDIVTASLCQVLSRKEAAKMLTLLNRPLTEDQWLQYRAWVDRYDIQTTVRLKINRLREEIGALLPGMPNDVHANLSDFCRWADSKTCWDHKFKREAGYLLR